MSSPAPPPSLPPPLLLFFHIISSSSPTSTNYGEKYSSRSIWHGTGWAVREGRGGIEGEGVDGRNLVLDDDSWRGVDGGNLFQVSTPGVREMSPFESEGRRLETWPGSANRKKQI